MGVLLAPVALVILVTLISYGFTRLRVAAEPAIVVLAAVALDALAARRWSGGVSSRLHFPRSELRGARCEARRHRGLPRRRSTRSSLCQGLVVTRLLGPERRSASTGSSP